ncbi:Abi family protein [Microbacterium excoecariae]|uniref:Abi family protein n=1 Tax=Microbacterium excoecariae TaxID=2715210 RepID=UPI0014093642|nr:Abi family protein [Microbacterium excoecariae]NHI16257.1 Abi family protein [Microbacterium excoecariae]
MTVDSTYAKPFLTVPQQIRRMRQRGMDCGGDNDASHILQRYGYYRLSGYSYPYRRRPVPPEDLHDDKGREIRLDDFESGTTLAHVAAMYEFDHELRTRISDALSSLEVSFRFFIGHRLGKMDRFAHRKPHLLDAMHPTTPPAPTNRYAEWIEEYDRHETRAKDAFVQHFRETYGNHLPIWVATEVMGFGVLSNLFILMPDTDQEILAARFQIYAKSGRGDSGALSNWLNNLRNIRNICAHYGRLWNRTFDVLIDTPGHELSSATDTDTAPTHISQLLDRTVSNKLYGVLIIMRHLTLSTDPASDKVIALLEYITASADELGFDLAELGVPADWSTQPVWQRNFRLPGEPMLAASMLDRAACMSSSEVKAMLNDTPDGKKPSELLKTYRHFNTVVEIPLAGVNYFPEFQFRDGAVIDALAEINKRFIDEHSHHDHLVVHSALLHWWQAPQDTLPLNNQGEPGSPSELLDEVDEEEFDRIINQTGATESLTL